MQKKVRIVILISMLLFIPGCGAVEEKPPIKQVQVDFEEAEEIQEPGSKAEINFDREKLQGYGVGFLGIRNTISFEIIPLDNKFDLEIQRAPNVLKANFNFGSEYKDTLSFVVDLEKNELIEKTIETSEFALSNLSDSDILDLAHSMKRMYEPLANWK